MPTPSTTPDLIALIRRSGLIVDPQSDEFLSDAHPDLTPSELLAGLIGDGALTPFQADQLALGRFRGFVLGGYRLLDRLGDGRDGPGLPGRARRQAAAVAVKVLAARLADDPVARDASSARPGPPPP